MTNPIFLIANGASVLSAAARHRYTMQSEELRQLRDEVMSLPSSPAADVVALRSDCRRIAKDVRVCYNRIIKTGTC